MNKPKSKASQYRRSGVGMTERHWNMLEEFAKADYDRSASAMIAILIEQEWNRRQLHRAELPALPGDGKDAK